MNIAEKRSTGNERCGRGRAVDTIGEGGIGKGTVTVADFNTGCEPKKQDEHMER